MEDDTTPKDETTTPAPDVLAELEAKHAAELDAERAKHATELDELDKRRLGELAQQREALTHGMRATPPARDGRAPTPDAPATSSRSPRAPMLRLEALEAHGACGVGVEFFLGRCPKGTTAHEWNADEARASHTRSPKFLEFLEARGLVPMLEVDGLPSVEKRLAAILDKNAAVSRVVTAMRQRFAPSSAPAPSVKGSP